MSLLLAFDTSTPEGTVALQHGDRGAVERRIGSSVRHAESLLPAIAGLLDEGGFRPSDLAGIVVGSGPGSFTGVRIAAATARGLARALGIPLHAYGSLLAEAAATGPVEGPVCALFDARRDEVYAACYRFGADGGEPLLAAQAATLDEVLERLRDVNPSWTGEGAEKHAHALPTAPIPAVMTRAAALLGLALGAPRDGLIERPGEWEPEYLRPPGAERMRR